MSHYLPALVSLLALLLFEATAVAVVFARKKFNIVAPATTGNSDFERVFRVQMNTLENLVMFLPALWLFAFYVSDLYAGILGFVWLVGRSYYAFSYSRSAAARSPGFGIGFLAFAVLWVGALMGIGVRIVAGN